MNIHYKPRWWTWDKIEKLFPLHCDEATHFSIDNRILIKCENDSVFQLTSKSVHDESYSEDWEWELFRGFYCNMNDKNLYVAKQSDDMQSLNVATMTMLYWHEFRKLSYFKKIGIYHLSEDTDQDDISRMIIQDTRNELFFDITFINGECQKDVYEVSKIPKTTYDYIRLEDYNRFNSGFEKDINVRNIEFSTFN